MDAGTRGWHRALGGTAFVAAMLLATGPAGSAELPGPLHGGPAEHPAKPTPAFLKALRKHIDATANRERAFQRKLDTVEERAERVRSRTKSSGLPRGEAVEALRAAHPEVIKEPPFAALTAARDERVSGFTSDYGAVVEGLGPAGQTGLRMSSTPLRVQDGEEGKKPVDLTLERTGNGFEPRMPIVPIVIGSTSAAGMALAGGFSASPVGADVPGTLEGNAVFFANVARDTDWVVRPDSIGAETYHVLRSADSPEELRLHVGLQPGATLSQGKNDEVLVQMNGRTLGQISPVFTWDANDQPVPTTTRVDGDEIVIRVEHHGRDVAYPLQADPTFGAGFYFDYQGDEVFSYWGWYDVTAGGYVDPTLSNGWFRPFGGGGYGGRALYIGVPQPGRRFAGGEQAFWYYRAPGAARIYHVRMNSSNNDVPASLQLCAFWGIANASISAYEGGAHGEGCGPHYNFAYDFNNNSPSPGNVWLVGEYAYQSSGQGTFWGTAFHKDAQIDMLDFDDPMITRWTGNVDTVGDTQYIRRASDVIGVNATDGSLGIASLTFSGPPNWAGNTTINFLCPVGPCPRAIPANGIPDPITGQHQPPPEAPAGTMNNGQPVPDGRQQITATVTDVVGHTDTESAVLVFDHNTPVVELSGSLWDARGGVLDADVESWGLHVRASDAGSGAKTIKIYVDGVLQASTDPAAGACPRADGTCELTWTYDAYQHSWAQHTIRVEAYDANPYNVQRPTVVEFNVNDTDTPSTDWSQVGDGTCDGAPCLADPARPPFVQEVSAFGALESPSLRTTATTQLPFVWGIADNNFPPEWKKPDDTAYNIWTDPLFVQLAQEGSSIVRRTVPWNVALLPDDGTNRVREGMEKWISDAISAGQTPVIAFERCTERAPGQQATCQPDPSGIPSMAEWRQATNAFMDTPPFSQVHTLTAWNEPNFADQPLRTNGVAAGQLAGDLHQRCSVSGHCFVIAADLLDVPLNWDNLLWFVDFRNGFGQSGYRPSAYGWHAYSDGKRRIKPGAPQSQYWLKLRTFINATSLDAPPSGRAPWIFLTEQGTVFTHPGDSVDKPRRLDEPRAVQMLMAYLNEATRLSPRIRMFAYYQMQGDKAIGEFYRWDSGLRTPNGTVRQNLYDTYRYGRPNDL